MRLMTLLKQQLIKLRLITQIYLSILLQVTKTYYL